MKTDAKIQNIESRNAKVEADKAWELSWSRRVIIALSTYGIIAGYLCFLGLETQDAFLHTLVPALAYMLSTISLPIFKTFWIERVYCPENKE